MSNRPNHRRDETRRTEHGPRYENANPGAGCNSTHVARGRAKWKKIMTRRARRACLVNVLRRDPEVTK